VVFYCNIDENAIKEKVFTAPVLIINLQRIISPALYKIGLRRFTILMVYFESIVIGKEIVHNHVSTYLFIKI